MCRETERTRAPALERGSLGLVGGYGPCSDSCMWYFHAVFIENKKCKDQCYSKRWELWRNVDPNSLGQLSAVGVRKRLVFFFFRCGGRPRHVIRTPSNETWTWRSCGSGQDACYTLWRCVWCPAVHLISKYKCYHILKDWWWSRENICK